MGSEGGQSQRTRGPEGARRGHWVNYFVWLRAIAAISIVFMHAIVSTMNDAVPEVTSPTAKAVGQAFMIPLTRWAVPVFFMVTGALLLDPRKEVGPDRIKRYVGRMVVILLTFGYVFSVSQRVIEDGLSGFAALGNGLVSLAFGSSWDHMWYVYALIGIYLLIPALRAFVRAASRETYRFTLIVLYVLCFVVPTLNELTILDFTTLHVPSAIYPVCYVLLGYYAHRYLRLDGRSAVVGAVVGVASGVAATAIGVWGELAETSVDIAFFPQSALILPYALLVFLAFKRFLDPVPVDRHPAIREVDHLGLGLYVIHPIFVHAFVALVPVSVMPLPAYVLCCFAVALALGLAGTWALKKIPWYGKFL